MQPIPLSFYQIFNIIQSCCRRDTSSRGRCYNLRSTPPRPVADEKLVVIPYPPFACHQTHWNL